MRINMPVACASLALAVALGTAVTRSTVVAAETAVVVPAPVYRAPAPQGIQTAVFAGGCFWGVQGVYQHVKGVRSAVAGYAGGTAVTARYDRVSTGRTRHAEAVRIAYDPAQVSYGTLLQIFFSVVADPTTLNVQGPDRGPQYRTAIFPRTPEQRTVARHYIEQLATAGIWPRPIVTRIEAGRFFRAEAYHQDFLVRQPRHPYIQAHDMPKIAALKRLFPAQYREKVVLAGGSAG